MDPYTVELAPYLVKMLQEINPEAVPVINTLISRSLMNVEKLLEAVISFLKICDKVLIVKLNEEPNFDTVTCEQLLQFSQSKNCIVRFNINIEKATLHQHIDSESIKLLEYPMLIEGITMNLQPGIFKDDMHISNQLEMLYEIV